MLKMDSTICCYRTFLRVCVSVNTITKSMNIYLIIRVYSSFIEINQKNTLLPS